MLSQSRMVFATKSEQTLRPSLWLFSGLSSSFNRALLCAGLVTGTASLVGVSGNEAFATPVPFTILHTFVGEPTEGSFPIALIQGLDGNLYGLTNSGGSSNVGTIFEITSGGTFSTLYSFPGGTGGSYPISLIEASDGNLYGIAQFGGANNYGLLFKSTLSGVVTPLHSFSNSGDGSQADGLLQASDGNIYGITRYGGNLTAQNCSPAGCGTIFKETLAGVFSTVYTFGGGSDSAEPSDLIQGASGDLYGATFGTISINGGSVFDFNISSRSVTSIYTFTLPLQGGISIGGYVNSDGCSPQIIIQGSDGNLYGSNYYCDIYGWGNIFQLAPSIGSKPSTLFTFASTTGNSGLTNGGMPIPLIQGSDGLLYGGATVGGTNSNGGALFNSYPYPQTFDSTYVFPETGGSPPVYLDGATPYMLLEGSGGKVYGIAAGQGPNNGQGIVFRMTAKLPIINGFLPTPASAPIGATVNLNGSDISSATSVTFNGTTAQFTQIEPTQISVVVPTGASSGLITVNTPGGPVQSGVTFEVTSGVPPLTTTLLTSGGSVGTPVEIDGSGFTSVSSVSFAGTAATFTVQSDNSIMATVPASAESGEIQITSPGGTSFTPDFTVLPEIDGYSPASGPVGTLVTFTGSGFTDTNGVEFNTTAASFTILSDSTLTATVPTGASSGPLTVTTADGAATDLDQFSIGSMSRQRQLSAVQTTIPELQGGGAEEPGQAAALGFTELKQPATIVAESDSSAPVHILLLMSDPGESHFRVGQSSINGADGRAAREDTLNILSKGFVLAYNARDWSVVDAVAPIGTVERLLADKISPIIADRLGMTYALTSSPNLADIPGVFAISGLSQGDQYTTNNLIQQRTGLFGSRQPAFQSSESVDDPKHLALNVGRPLGVIEPGSVLVSDIESFDGSVNVNRAAQSRQPRQLALTNSYAEAGPPDFDSTLGVESLSRELNDKSMRIYQEPFKGTAGWLEAISQAVSDGVVSVLDAGVAPCTSLDSATTKFLEALSARAAAENMTIVAEAQPDSSCHGTNTLRPASSTSIPEPGMFIVATTLNRNRFISRSEKPTPFVFMGSIHILPTFPSAAADISARIENQIRTRM